MSAPRLSGCADVGIVWKSGTIQTEPGHFCPAAVCWRVVLAELARRAGDAGKATLADSNVRTPFEWLR